MDNTGLYSRVLAVSRAPELRLGGGELVHPPARVHAVHLVVLHLLRREHRRLVVHDAPARVDIMSVSDKLMSVSITKSAVAELGSAVSVGASGNECIRFPVTIFNTKHNTSG